MNVVEVIKQRTSTRAFLDKPVARETIEDLLNVVRWAPSSANTQPCHVAILMSELKERLGEEIIAARESGQSERPDFPYYPNEWVDPYKSRRRACGLALYRSLNIGKNDNEKRKQVWYNNYRFFGAPVGLLFLLDKQMGQSALVDIGIFMQTLMLAAPAFGLATCPQASLAEFPDIAREVLGLSDELVLVSGMSLGYPDASAAVNQYRTARAELDEFVKWYE